jgi:hypothetical protein
LIGPSLESLSLLSSLITYGLAFSLFSKVHGRPMPNFTGLEL